MMALEQIRQLVRNHVISDTQRQLQQFPIEINDAVPAARAPPIADITDVDSCGCNPYFGAQ